MTEQVQETNQEVTANAEQKTKQRPVFLTVLCILTFIGSGLGVLFGLLALVASGYIDSLASSIPGMSSMLGDNMFTSIMAFLLSGASLYGAIMMWQLKKMGFYIYAGAQVVMLIVGFSVFTLIFTALWVTLYYLNVKHME